MDPLNCSNEKITAYLSGGYPYVYVESDNGNRLYNGSGLAYCSDGPGLICTEAYVIDEILKEWYCRSAEDLIDNDQDGYSFLEDLNDNDPCIPDPNTLACGSPPQNDQLFEDYPFLEDLVDRDTCTRDSILVSASPGNATYFFVGKANSGILYNVNGLRYCANQTNYNCLELYPILKIVETWFCGGTSPTLPVDQDGTFSDLDPDDDTPSVSKDELSITVPDSKNTEIKRANKITPTVSDDFKVYPNPSTGPLFIDMSSLTSIPETIIVRNSTGQILLSQQISDSQLIELNLNGQATGVYFIQLQSKEGVLTKRFVLH